MTGSEETAHVPGPGGDTGETLADPPALTWQSNSPLKDEVSTPVFKHKYTVHIG